MKLTNPMSLVKRYFHFLADQSFRTDEDGEVHFSPLGPFGRSMVVPDEKTKTRIVKKSIVLHALGLTAIVAGASWATGGSGAILLIALASLISLPLTRLYFAREYRELQLTEKRLRFAQVAHDMANRMDARKLLMGTLLCIGLMLASMLSLAESLPADAPAMSVFGIVLFGLFVVTWGKALRIRRYLDQKSVSQI